MSVVKHPMAPVIPVASSRPFLVNLATSPALAGLPARPSTLRKGWPPRALGSGRLPDACLPGVVESRLCASMHRSRLKMSLPGPNRSSHVGTYRERRGGSLARAKDASTSQRGCRAHAVPGMRVMNTPMMDPEYAGPALYVGIA